MVVLSRSLPSRSRVVYPVSRWVSQASKVYAKHRCVHRRKLARESKKAKNHTFQVLPLQSGGGSLLVQELIHQKRNKERRLMPARSKRRHKVCQKVHRVPSAHCLQAQREAFCCLLCSAKTSREMASTLSKPSRPLAAFLLNLSTVTSSMLFLIFCQPPHIAMTLAVWSKIVLPGVFAAV
jgi:hypothetical protein